MDRTTFFSDLPRTIVAVGVLLRGFGDLIWSFCLRP